jgi:transcriptional regulator with XRE-family HTH domain
MPTRTSSDVEVLRRFGEHLRQYRIARNLTQEELAAKAGFSRSYYNEIETGKRNISLLNLKKLADCLDTSLSDLLNMG